MTTQAADGQNLNTELRQTELGEFILKNKGTVFGLVILILAGIIGYGIYGQMQESTEKESAAKFFALEQNELKAFSDGKLSSAELVAKFAAVESGMTNAKFVSALLVSDSLMEKGNYKEAISILSSIKASNDYQIYLSSFRLAAAFEGTNQIDKAILELEKLKSSQLKLMEGKLYLDLGRLYMQVSKNDLAKESLNKVNGLNTQKVFKTMATYYLNQIK